jgi:hypothetical protein
MDTNYFKLVSKYAIVLTVLYLIEYVADIYINEFIYSGTYDTTLWAMRLTPNLFTLVLNGVCALIVARDIRAHNVKTQYVIIATILFRPIGVCALLLYLYNHDRKESMPSDALIIDQ